MAAKTKSTSALDIETILEQAQKNPSNEYSVQLSIQILNALGATKGHWGFEVKAQLERMFEWVDAPLWVRAFAYIKRHTLCYLNSAAGADLKTFRLDARKYGHCKRHGALLAVTETRGKRIIPVGPRHIKKALNEAAIKAVSHQAGRDLTAEEIQRISVDADDMRRALDHLESLGMCLRTDAADVPLSEHRKTEEGRLALRKMSGDNQSRIYLYLRPKPAVAQKGLFQCLPQDAKREYIKGLYKSFLGLKLDSASLTRLKPLYRTVLDLGLDIEPLAFATNDALHERVRGEIEYRERLIAKRDEQLRQSILEEYPSALLSEAPAGHAPVEVVGLNSPVASVPPPVMDARKPATQPAVSPDKGREAETGSAPAILSQPRKKPVASPVPAVPDYDAAVIAAFVDHGKPSPTPQQVHALKRALPDTPEARAEFIGYLFEKMPRIKHAGVLPSIAAEFSAAWPAKVARRQAEMAQEQRQQIVVDPLEELVATIDLVETLPGSVDHAANLAFVEAARKADLKLYEEAMRIYGARAERAKRKLAQYAAESAAQKKRKQA